MAKEHPHIKGGQGHTDTDLSLQGGAIVGLLMAIGLLIILAALITLAIYAPIPFMLTLFALIIMIPRHRPH